MNVLLLFPPQWMPISPYFALPSLMAQLLKAGYSTKAIDLNIKFYNDVLKKNYIENAINKAKVLQPQLLKKISKHHMPNKQMEDYPFEIQNAILRYAKIKDFTQNKTYQLENIPHIVEDAVGVMKSEEFYKPQMFAKALHIIDSALEIATLPYAPYKLSFASYDNPFFKLNYKSIKQHVFDEEGNLFLEYYRQNFKEIVSSNPNYIGISINSSTQIIPGLTLAYLLKKKTDAHINIGGNFFGRVVDALADNLEFFELFAHSILVEEGEKPVVDLAKYIEGKIPITEVGNLVYVQNGKMQINSKVKPTPLNEMAPIVLDGYNLKDYLTPEIVMPHQTSKGCYWGKCSFCDQDFGQNFNIKNIEKLILELSELKNKYGISNFEFIDESISPSYMDEMAKKITESGLEIDYFSNARLEGTFSEEILKNARKSGLRMLLWGLESGSDKIMELINKGIDLEKRFEILKNSKDADIWNFAFIFFGFPAETTEDAYKTIEMLCNNNDIIDSYGRSVFTMGKHTKLRENPEHYGIIGVSEQQDELSPSFDFKASGMSPKELSEVIKTCTKSCANAYHNPLWMYLKYREFLFLYIKKYGRNWVKNYKMEV